MPVHPRLRGELEKEFIKPANHCGSSPLTRGTPISSASFISAMRFIPAYAGNSFGNNSQAHISNGSSPLTRGTLRRELKVLGPGRFIPAYAGNSGAISAGMPNGSVHPRLRGELCFSSSKCSSGCGSSPLTRGTLFSQLGKMLLYRFIPAYAGNSNPDIAGKEYQEVHPRLRGELLSLISHQLFLSRFIPAYAGNSCVLTHLFE